MSQGTKLGNTNEPALGLRNRLVLGAALATSAFLGGYRGYVRRAYADCAPAEGGPAGTYICSGTTPTTQRLPPLESPPAVLDVTTDNTFSISTAAGNALTLTGTGGLRFSDFAYGDPNFSAIAGAVGGIDARNYVSGDTGATGGSGALSIATTGTVTGTSGTGIYARNNVGTTNLTIQAADVSGGTTGIDAHNYGTGALSITANGTVTGTSGYGIYANNSGGTDLTIEAANVSGGTSGIHAEHYSTGALSITATGKVTGTEGDGIYARTISDVISSTDLTIEAVDVSGGTNGINADHTGTGALSITATGTVTGTSGIGIDASNDGTALTIVAADVSGGTTGIDASNFGSGALSITATGAVTGTSASGIYARNYGTDLTIDVAGVNGATYGIRASNYGSGALSITASGAVTGTTNNGIYALNENGTNLTIDVAGVSGGTYGVRALNYGSGALSVTTGAVIGANGDGIYANNDGSGALSITATGAVTGNSGRGIYALNDNFSSTNLTIDVASVDGGTDGIRALNYGSGALSITTSGEVTGTDNIGIYALNDNNVGTNLTIDVAGVSGGTQGITAVNFGSGALSITATGAVKGTSLIGIFAGNYNGTDLTIVAARVSGGLDGIFARNIGSGALSITATGAITGTSRTGVFAIEGPGSGALSIIATGTVTGGEDGIYAVNYGTDLTIQAADVSGGAHGIHAQHYGTGALSITTTGTVTGTNDSGILAEAFNNATTILQNTGSIAGATGILANTVGPVTITNAGSITGTGGTAIDLTNAGASTVNQQGGVITGNILLSASPDVVSVAGGAITGNVVGGAGDDKVTVSGGTITGNVTGDDGDDIVAVSGGTIRGSVTGGAGFDQVSVSGGTIKGGIDADHVDLSGGTIDGDITGLGPNTLIINGSGAVDPLNLADGVLFSGTGANGTVTDTDLAAGGKSQNFTGFDNFSADASTLRFSGGTQGINQLNLGNGSTLFINGNVTMPGSIIATNSTLFINGNLTMPGSIIATNSLIDMTNDVANDVLRLGGLTLNGARIGLDINQQTVQSDQLLASAFSATGANTIIVNLLGTPQFAQATDIPLIVSTSGPIAGTFDVKGIPGTPGSLFTYEIVAGPNGLFLRATPANFGIAAAPTSATNAGAVTVAIDALYGINRDALDADLNLSPATGGAMVPVSSSFGVFASGQFAHTEHDGYDISGGGLNGPGPSFDANDFSAAISLDFNAAKHFQFDNEYGLNIGIFAGYASTDVNLGGFRGFDAIGEGTNKAGMFGGYALFRKNYDYALVSASGFIGGSDVTNGVLGTTGSYDTEGYAVTASVGHIFKLGERTRFDLRGGLLGVSFRGDPYTDSGGNEFGKSKLSFGAIKFEPGIYGDYTLSNGMVLSPYARFELQQRFGYRNTTEIDTREIDFDDVDFSAALSTGFNLKMSELTTVSGEVRGKASSDSSTIGAKLGVKIAF